MNPLFTSFAGALILTMVYYWYVSSKKDKNDYTVQLVVCFLASFLFVYCAQTLMACGSKQDEMMKYIDKTDPTF